MSQDLEQMETEDSLLWFLLKCGVVTAIYFAPAIGAIVDRKRNWLAITLLNLLLGWTCIGWIVALVWAACKDRPEGTWAPTSSIPPKLR